MINFVGQSLLKVLLIFDMELWHAMDEETAVVVNLLNSFVTLSPLFVSSNAPMAFGCISKKYMFRFTLDHHSSRR